MSVFRFAITHKPDIGSDIIVLLGREVQSAAFGGKPHLSLPDAEARQLRDDLTKALGD